MARQAKKSKISNASNQELALAHPQRTFHPFPRLPIELRQEILGLLKPEPRTVTIWSKIGGDNREREEKRKNGPPSVPTALLYVNREIRELAQKWCTLAFGTQLAGRAIFIDFNRDTLRMSCGESLTRLYGVHSSTAPQPQLAHMAEIEAKVRFPVVHNNFPSPLIGLVSRFHNLETLTANYDIKPHSERLLVRQMTKRARDNGWELRIPKFSVGDGSFRDMHG